MAKCWHGDASEAETYAMRYDLRLTEDFGCHSLEVESDLLMLTSMLNCVLFLYLLLGGYARIS